MQQRKSKSQTLLSSHTCSFLRNFFLSAKAQWPVTTPAITVATTSAATDAPTSAESTKAPTEKEKKESTSTMILVAVLGVLCFVLVIIVFIFAVFLKRQRGQISVMEKMLHDTRKPGRISFVVSETTLMSK